MADLAVGVLLAPWNGWQDLDEALSLFHAAGIETVELSTVGRQVALEYDLSELLESAPKRDDLVRRFAKHGLTISSFSCHGNALHPSTDVSAAQISLFSDTVRLAGLLGIETVVDFSGCPGERASSTYPNWVTCSWPDEFAELHKWQWEECVIPHWAKMADILAAEGVRVAIEMHPGQNVYTPSDVVRLRDAVGPSIGANFDPSQLFWQQIDILGSIRYLADAIYHVHLKDAQIRQSVLDRVGVGASGSFEQARERGWDYRVLGYGHSASFWTSVLSTLREVDFGGPLSIEYGDPQLGIGDGLIKAARLIHQILPECEAPRARIRD